MIKIVVQDDKKEKPQSCTATFEWANLFKKISDTTIVESYNLGDLAGYGETIDEAVENLKKAFEYILADLCAVSVGLDNDNIYIETK